MRRILLVPSLIGLSLLCGALFSACEQRTGFSLRHTEAQHRHEESAPPELIERCTALQAAGQLSPGGTKQR